MKKLASALLIGVCALGLAACDQQGSSPSNSDTSATATDASNGAATTAPATTDATAGATTAPATTGSTT